MQMTPPEPGEPGPCGSCLHALGWHRCERDQVAERWRAGSLHNGQFDGTKLTNATRAEDPVSFWGDCAWILMWLTLFFCGWIYVCIEALFSA